MKKIISILLTVLIIGCFGMEAKTSKKSGKKNATSSGVVVTKGKTKQYGDYLTTQFFTIAKGKNKKVTLEFPIDGNDKLVNSIRKYLLSEINLEDKNTQTIESLLKKADIRDLCSNPQKFNHTHSVTYDNEQIISFATYCDDTLLGGNSFIIEDGTSLCDVIENDLDNLKPYLLREMPNDWLEDNYGSFFVKGQKLYFRAFYDIFSFFNTIETRSLNIPSIYNVVSPKVQLFFK